MSLAPNRFHALFPRILFMTLALLSIERQSSTQLIISDISSGLSPSAWQTFAMTRTSSTVIIERTGEDCFALIHHVTNYLQVNKWI